MNVMPKAVSQEAGSAGLCSRPALGETTVGGTTQPVTWQLPEETPVALQINSEPYTVMMATPADLRDFAIGFLVGEGIVKNARDIQGVLVMPVESGMAVDVAVPETSLETSRLARRAIEGRTGCGLCGVEDIASALRPLPILARSWSPATDVIQRAAEDLFQHQPMNRLNRSVHGAAWVSQDGQILLVREDVGRHNALDKLIGALLLKDAEPARRFCADDQPLQLRTRTEDRHRRHRCAGHRFGSNSAGTRSCPQIKSLPGGTWAGRARGLPFLSRFIHQPNR